MSGAAVKGSGRRSPRSLARTTSIPYRMNRTWFFIAVTITLLSRANAAALRSARCVPAVFSVTLKLPVPLLRAARPGRAAWLSLLAMVTGPLKALRPARG